LPNIPDAATADLPKTPDFLPERPVPIACAPGSA
jgi:hypothetical protein